MGITGLALLKDLDITHIKDMRSPGGLDHGIAVIKFALSVIVPKSLLGIGRLCDPLSDFAPSWKRQTPIVLPAKMAFNKPIYPPKKRAKGDYSWNNFLLNTYYVSSNLQW